MEPREIDAVRLGPTGNLQGRMYCFSLVSGRVLNRLWKDVPMLNALINAIKRIDFMAKKH